MKRTLTALATALALSGCLAAPDAPSRGAGSDDHGLRPLLASGTENLRGHVDARSAAQMRASDAPFFRPPPDGGYTDFQTTITLDANLRGKTAVVDRPLVSASTTIALTVTRIIVADPNAPWFGVHHPILAAPGTTDFSVANIIATGRIDLAESRRMFAAMGAPGCFDYYQRQPEAAANEIVKLTWNQMERNCR